MVVCGSVNNKIRICYVGFKDMVSDPFISTLGTKQAVTTKDAITDQLTTIHIKTKSYGQY